MKPIFINKLAVYVCLWLLAVPTLAAQAKKAPQAPVPGPSLGKICDDPYQVRDAADGLPEGPVYILFHHQDSKAPWVHNPLIKAPGLETATAASAHTLVCVEETRLEMGKYDSGEAGYTPSWDVVLVRIPDRKVYFMKVGFHGESPPEVKYHRGAGVGKQPIAPFVRWLRLVVDQKVARPKMRLSSKEYAEPVALAFSSDGSKLVLAQESRSTLDGTPPSPVTVFDVSSGQIVRTLKLDYPSRRVAISKTGEMIATDRYGGYVEVWDTASGKMTHKLDTSGQGALVFGPNDELGTAGKGNAVVWNAHSGTEVHSGKGDYISTSSDGAWITAGKDGDHFTAHEMESGRLLTTFPAISDQSSYALSRDFKTLASYSSLSAHMYVAGKPESQLLSLPATSMGMDVVNGVRAVAPTANGFVIGSSDGIVGIISASESAPRMFATEHGSIQAIAVSPDGKLIALAEYGNVSIWELR